jgi:cytoskeletal protein CcmA (bactofilin family)
MAEKETIIGPETRISGEVRGDEDLVVRGRIDGRVQLTAVLTVEAGGIVQADVQARAVVIAGVVVGNVTAAESIRLGDKSKVIGDLTAPRVVLEGGAAYRGRVEMGEVDLAKVAEARASSRRSSEKDAAKAPPRMTTPARAAVNAPASIVRAASAAPRTVPAPPRPAPSMPRPEVTANGGVASAPAWAKKKLRRR